MKLITEFENYVLKELDRTISEDGHVVSYALTCQSNEHQFINLKQVDDDYIRFEMYFENIRIQSDYFFTNETPETQMKILKRLFENTLSDYKRDIWEINEITKKAIAETILRGIEIVQGIGRAVGAAITK